LIPELGGERRAAEKLGLYLRMPGFAAPHKYAAADLLAHCGRWGSRELVYSLGGSADADLRAHVAPLLDRADADLAVPALIAAVDDPDRKVRYVAVQSLGNMRTTSAVPALVKALRDADRKVQARAAEALGQIGSPANSSIPALEQALAESHLPVRQAAAEALKKIRAAQEKE
jgi:HEAT repeat protein